MSAHNGNGKVAPDQFPPPVNSQKEFIKHGLDDEDELIEVGVAIVGGGTAGLACANRLLQLLADDPETMERLGEVPVAVVEKAKTCGGQVRHLLRGRGQDVHGNARILMGVGALEHLWVQPRKHPSEHARREPLQVAHRHPRDHLPHALAHVIGAIIGRAAQAEAEVLVQIPRQTRARDHSRLIGRTSEEHARGARHQRLVEVEEGGRPRPPAVAAHERLRP